MDLVLPTAILAGKGELLTVSLSDSESSSRGSTNATNQNIRLILKNIKLLSRLLPFWSLDFDIFSGMRNGTDDIFREITGVPGVSSPR